MPAQVIDKGIPTSGLLSQVLVAKDADHIPLYRQERTFGRAGYAIPVSDLKAVVYDFALNRSGEHARNVLGDWRGKLVCDDYGGYKASFGPGVTEIGCMAHARRKFFDLQSSGKSQLAAQVLGTIGQLYDNERESKDFEEKQRQQGRTEKARPIADALQQWMQAQRQRVLDGSAIMSLIQLAKINGHDPYAYLKDVLTRLPTHKNNAIEGLLPHNWKPVMAGKV